MKQLTVRQQEVFDLLVKYQNEHGYAPTITELARLMGVASSNAAAQQLRALHRKGAINLIPAAHRGISINNQAPQLAPEDE